MACGLRNVGLAAALALAPTAAPAITWNIDFGSVATTFEAPAGGGAVTGLVVTLGGLEFNTPEAGGSAPVFDPVENHFEPIGGGLFSYFLNPAHSALLEFETIDAEQIDDIVQGKPPRPPKSTGSTPPAPGRPPSGGVEGAAQPA